MISFVLSLALVSQANGLVGEHQNPMDACVKYDGENVTPCERALFNKAVQFGEALNVCALQHQSCQSQNEQLKQLVLNQPLPETKPSWSLFGLPGWITPVLAGVLLGGGVVLGLTL